MSLNDPAQVNSSASDLTISAPQTPSASFPDLVCFAHLHWDFVWQRPQHLLSRFAQHGRVLYVEEPFVDHNQIEPFLEIKERQNGVKVVVAHLPFGLTWQDSDAAQSKLLAE